MDIGGMLNVFLENNRFGVHNETKQIRSLKERYWEFFISAVNSDAAAHS